MKSMLSKPPRNPRNPPFDEFLFVFECRNFSREIASDNSQAAQNCHLLTNFYLFRIFVVLLVSCIFLYFSRIAEGIGKCIFTLRENTKIRGVKYSKF